MVKGILLLTLSLACLVFLIHGVSHRPVSNTTPAPQISYVAEPLPATIPEERQPKELLRRLLGLLREVSWLQTTIWQRRHDPDDGFTAESRLLLAPGHCARLETTLTSGTINCRVLVVSDGHAMAEVLSFPGQPDTVISSNSLADASPPAREKLLLTRGCAGPGPLLRELYQVVADWKVETGSLNGRPVVRLSGTVNPRHPRFVARAALAARSCRIYLDAASLWPMRLEWWTGADAREARLCLEMEYREPELNRALSPEECARLFTYEPDENTKFETRRTKSETGSNSESADH